MKPAAKPKKQSSSAASSIAGKMLRRGRPDWMPAGYWTDIRTLAGSVLSQDEIPSPKGRWANARKAARRPKVKDRS